MWQYWNFVGIISAIVFLNVVFVESRFIVKRQIDSDISIDPVIQDVTYDGDDRDKRAVGHTDPKYAIKNALLGFVFNPSKGSSVTSTTTKRPSTTEDIVIFEKDKPASLDLPSQLFGSSFTTVTRVSTAVGDYMINSAIRLQRLLEVFRPVIRSAFGVNGFVSEVITNKPIFSDGSNTA